MKYNILCQKEEQNTLTDFYEKISQILKECDECEEKEKIKEILRSMNENVSYIFLGEQEVGKTTLLKGLFQDILDISGEMQGDICEYRYGEQEFVTPSVNGYQKKFVVSENMQGISVIDTKGLNQLADSSLKRIKDLTTECQAIFVVLDARRINSPVMWDMIEDFPHKNMVFVLTKCNLISAEDLDVNKEKIRCYMKEADISAPVFCVSNLMDEDGEAEYIIDELRSYIRNQVIGENPILAKQRKNIEETRLLLAQMRESFLLRSKQYQSDVEILHKINQGLDAYVLNQEVVIENLVGMVTEQIHKDIDAYQSEIISKMAPYKIKERFKTQQDFVNYLNMVNENYKRIMTDSVNRKTIDAIKGSLRKLELVYDDAVGYFNERESILALNDKFYGSLSVGRRQMVEETKENAVIVSQFYQTLTEASEELFLQIWEERKKHDEKLAVERTLSKVSGGVVGAAGSVLAIKALMAVGLKLGGALLLGAGLVPISVIVGATTIYSIAKVLYEPRADRHMEEVTQNCIAQFKDEISKTKAAMTEQIALQIRDIFAGELATVDRLFAEFRMSVNIDERKLPLLDVQLNDIEKLLQIIDSL